MFDCNCTVNTNYAQHRTKQKCHRLDILSLVIAWLHIPTSYNSSWTSWIQKQSRQSIIHETFIAPCCKAGFLCLYNNYLCSATTSGAIILRCMLKGKKIQSLEICKRFLDRRCLRTNLIKIRDVQEPIDKNLADAISLYHLTVTLLIHSFGIYSYNFAR